MCGDIDFVCKFVVWLGEMDDAAFVGPGVPGVVWVVDLLVGFGISKEEILNLHLVCDVGIQRFDFLEELVWLEGGEGTPVLQLLSANSTRT